MHSVLFLILMFLIKILSSFVKDAMFVNINYVTNDPPHLQRIYLTTAGKNYQPVFNQPYSVLFFLQNNINHISSSSLIKVINSQKQSGYFGPPGN